MAAVLRWLVLGAAALATVWLLWPRPQPMPEVSFTLTDGRVLDPAALHGKALLVNFWSVNCTVCLRDMPALDRLHQSLQGFMVIGVAASYDPPPAVMETVARLQPAYPIALDVQGELAHAFGGVNSTPTSFLVDRAGNIHYVERGALDVERVRATVLTFR
jgi:thiol-disulfide isomerase/thioredoxin